MEDGANTDAEETVNEEKEEENKESKILAEIEQVLKKLGTEVKDIAGIIIVNSDGITVKSTLENSLSLQYSVLISQLSDRAKSIVRELDGTNELVYLRIQSKKHEILVAPEEDFILIVVQDPSKKPEKDEV